LIRYPYGCTEQTLSSLYPLVVALQIGKRGYLSPQIYQSGLLLFNNGSQRSDPAPHINAAVEKLQLNQKAGGLMGYWPGNMYYQDAGDVQLSIYTYLVLSQLKQQ
jgi:uncharacterized protein YfaS (alpha-2-macroglobulin family)